MRLIVVEYSEIASTRLSPELDTVDKHVFSVDLVNKLCNFFIPSPPFILFKVVASISIQSCDNNNLQVSPSLLLLFKLTRGSLLILRYIQTCVIIGRIYDRVVNFPPQNVNW